MFISVTLKFGFTKIINVKLLQTDGELKACSIYFTQSAIIVSNTTCGNLSLSHIGGLDQLAGDNLLLDELLHLLLPDGKHETRRPGTRKEDSFSNQIVFAI